MNNNLLIISKVIIFYIQEYLKNNFPKEKNEFILLGGDEEISYQKMIVLLQNSLNKMIKVRKCIIITIPNKLFYTLLLPILWVSPKIL